jgi:PGF-CTERM protein
MTAERAQEEGTVVITSVSEAALAASDSLEVTVDGEAAVEASSHAELREAADGGDSSAYMVRQSGSAEATADVFVAVNHFSERQIAVSDGDDSDSSDGETTSDGSDDGDGASDGGGQPGFGVTAAIIALISVALARIRA